MTDNLRAKKKELQFLFQDVVVGIMTFQITLSVKKKIFYNIINNIHPALKGLGL